MKGIVASFIIFIGVLVGIGFSVNYVNTTCSNLLSKNNQLENIVKQDNWENGYNKSVKLLEEWQKKYKVLSVFIHHQKIDTINNELLELTQYVKFKQKAEALSKIHVVKSNLKNIMQAEEITVQNIF